MAAKKEFLTCRRILTIMTILSFMFQYMMRINISIAIVDMISSNTTNISTTTSSRHFNWTEKEKNDVLGSFFWGFFLSSMPGGRLSEMYGSRIVLGTAMFLASVLTLLTPVASYLNYYCLLVVRFSIGVTLGAAWPSILPIVTNWISPTETSKFMSHTLASQVGTALTLVISGYLIDYLTWPSVFYVTGGVAVVWSLAWFYLVYDSPEQHPRITQQEREQVEKSVSARIGSVKSKKLPLGKILTSGPVWAIIVANTCVLFNVNTAINHIPTYLNQVLHFNIRENGFLSSLPFFGTYFMALLSCYLADNWKKSKRFPVITIRRIFTSLAFLIPAGLLLIQSFWGYDRLVSVTVFVLWQTFCGCTIAGYTSNVLDIAPNYSGTIYGLATSTGGFTGFLTTTLVSSVVKDEQSFLLWRYIFWVCIVVNLVGWAFYYSFSSGEVQDWNSKSGDLEMDKLEQENLNT